MEIDVSSIDLSQKSGRWVYRDARIYPWSLCLFCGSGHGGDGTSHQAGVCLACGSVQCADRQSCRVCTYGLLVTFFNRDKKRHCGYMDCDGRAVTTAPRVGVCCETHMTQARYGSGKTSVTAAQVRDGALSSRESRFLWVPAPGPLGEYTVADYLAGKYLARMPG